MRKSRQSVEESDLEEPLINLTPLIDVVFVVLITFILIAPAIELERIELAEGGPASAKTPPKTSHLTIHVKADNTIWFEGRSLTVKQLQEALKNRKKQGSKETPQLIQDQKAAFGTYQTVKNTLEACGFEEMDVVLSPAKSCARS